MNEFLKILRASRFPDFGGSDNAFSFRLVSDVLEGWKLQEGGRAQPLPGNEGDLRFVLPKADVTSSDRREGTFTYEVSSDQHGEALNVTFTVVWIPQVSTSGYPDSEAIVEGTITDAATGQPIVDAQVTLWLGFTTTVMPYTMSKATDSAGACRVSCWDVNALNNHLKNSINRNVRDAPCP